MEKTVVTLATLEGTTKVEGYKISIEGIEFCVHKTLFNDKEWQATDVKCGLKVGSIQKTRKAVIESLESIVNKVGAESFKEKQDEALKRVEEMRKAKKEEEEPKQEEEAWKPKFEVGQIVVNENLKLKARIVKVLDQGKYLAQPIGHKIYTEKMTMFEMNLIEFIEEKKETEKKKADESLLKKAWFAGIKTIDELKKLYKKLAKQFHPDTSEYENASDVMKTINNQYEKAEKTVKRGGAVNSEGEQETNVNVPSDLQEAIDKISHLEGIEIKIRGTWLWVSGVGKEEFEKHEVLKSAGLRFGSKAQEWYIASETKGQKKRRGRGYSSDQLKEKFGEVNVSKGGNKKRYLDKGKKQKRSKGVS